MPIWKKMIIPMRAGCHSIDLKWLMIDGDGKRTFYSPFSFYPNFITASTIAVTHIIIHNGTTTLNLVCLVLLESPGAFPAHKRASSC